jgi:hypothetical protein
VLLCEDWKRGNISAIYKKGDKSNPEANQFNFKYMERIIKDEIVNFLEK